MTALSAAAPMPDMDETIPDGVRRRRRVLRWGAVAAPIAAIGAAVVYLALQSTADLAVDRQDLRISVSAQQPMSETASFAGRIIPRELMQIAAPEAGRIVAIHARSGDAVEEGALLLSLSNPERELAINERVARIRSDLFSLDANRNAILEADAADRRAVWEAEFARAEAAEILRRQEILYERGIVTDAHVDPLRERLDFLERSARQATETLERNIPFRAQQSAQIDAQDEALRADLEIARAQLESLTIRATASGVVMGFDHALGEPLNAGDPIAQIDPREGVMVVAQIDEFYAARVEQGQPGRAMVGGRALPLTVSHVSPDIRDGAFRVELEFEGEPPRIRPGETVQGAVTFPTAGEFVSIAVGPYLEQTGGSYLFVLDHDGRSARRRQVRSGIRSQDQIAILSGLEAGEQVIVSSYAGFGNAETLQIRSGQE